MAHMLDDVTYDVISPPGVGWVNFFRCEPVQYLSEYVCQIWLRSDGRVEKKSTDIQTDKVTLQLYIVIYLNNVRDPGPSYLKSRTG